MAEITRFSFPTQIRYGPGARAALAEFADELQVTRPLLVTDRGLPGTEAYRLTATALAQTWSGGYEASEGVHPNPVEADVEAVFRAYEDGGCDGVVGLGGGSALDVAKAARLRIAFPDLSLMDIAGREWPRRLAPFCAIPTTAGTGSEVGRSSVVTIPALGRKAVVGGQPLLADLAILDPELTVGLPPALTAATGMDALTHAIESFVCPVLHPMCDGIALEAIRLVRLHLPVAYANGTDLQARGLMQIAAAMGAVAFQKDLGVAHSLSHPLSSEFGLHHGLANATVLPFTVRFNGETDSGQYGRVAQALGLPAGDDPAAQVAECLAELNVCIGITQRLRDLGVPQTALPELAAKAMQDGCHLTNPRSCTEADMLRLYEEAW
ncbi:MAG: iron-containing alcohol dehydrogenase [Armatimonadetes bacterium]|nr:iron-containing alcohol dehydrogenase [Armatimonadota bacterium]